MYSVLKLLLIFCCALVNVSSFAALPFRLSADVRQIVAVELSDGEKIKVTLSPLGSVVPEKNSSPVAEQDSPEPENAPSTPIVSDSGSPEASLMLSSSHWPFLDSVFCHTSR